MYLEHVVSAVRDRAVVNYIEGFVMVSRSLLPHSTRGFTMVELLVVIAIVAILAVLAVPSFSKMIVKQQLNKSARDLASALSNARSQSALLRRNMTLHIAPSSAVTVSDTVQVWQPTNSVTVSSSTTTPNQVIFLPAGGMQILIGGAAAVSVSSTNTIKLCDSKSVNAIVFSFSVVGSVSQVGGSCL